MLMFIFASIQNAMFKLQVEGKNVHGPFKMQADFALEDTERMGLYLRQFQKQSVATFFSEPSVPLFFQKTTHPLPKHHVASPDHRYSRSDGNC